MDELTAAERRQVEVELLQAMYPEQVDYNPTSYEFRYSGVNGGAMLLRIPESYPERGLPELLSASDTAKNDMRSTMKTAIDDMKLIQGEELLDALVQGFEDVLSKERDVESDSWHKEEEADIMKALQKNSKTVIVWLHHLLNTNKRKLALNPSLNPDPDGGNVSGVNKPGYPGILVYSGPRSLVESHVAELKQQRWQAFQVRYDEAHAKDSVWEFAHGTGIREVESISEMVQSIIGESNKSAFLKATGVK